MSDKQENSRDDLAGTLLEQNSATDIVMAFLCGRAPPEVFTGTVPIPCLPYLEISHAGDQFFTAY